MKLNQVHLWAILGSVFLVRLISLGAYPLMDTTEARYGEMARIMTETGNWLTPQFDYNVPFWGKPPLFTWMSATGIETFGVNEFAVRFPHWLAGVGVVLLMASFARKLGFSGLITAVVLATCGMFIVASGAVMTDMALTLGLTLAMIGFYRCWQGYIIWGYVGFAGLAIGLLAKGPIVIILMGVAVVPWLIIQHGIWGAFFTLWQRFPVICGLCFMLTIALPWYYLAEQATPGFIDYFIVGEHFKRFFISGWEGDLYGSAHDEVRGTIWLYWFAAAMPWSIVLPILLWKKRNILTSNTLAPSSVVSFLACWMISPLVFFTFAGNILPAYVLPGLPAMALLVTILVSDANKDPSWFSATAGFVPLFLIVAVIAINSGIGNRKSDKIIFDKTDPSLPTFYVGNRPFSGQFYSQGKALKLNETSSALLFDSPDTLIPTFQLVGEKNKVAELVKNQALNCVVEYTENTKRSLYKCHSSLEMNNNTIPNN